MPITLSLLEDDRRMRESLVEFLSEQTELDLRIVNAYPTAEAALTGIAADACEVALIDVNLPGMSGIECVRRLKLALPALRILMLTTFEESEVIFAALRAGASGYVLKKQIASELVGAIRSVHEGGAPMSMEVARKVVAYFQPQPPPAEASELAKLTAREFEILNLLSEGSMYKEIAAKLGISFGTVRTHMQHIYEKLHVNSRTEATLKFIRRR